jgi:hypothetical protein
MKLIDASECPWGFDGYFGCEEMIYAHLKEPIDLQLKIYTESGIALPRMLGKNETLDKLLELAVDGAQNDSAGLILLRECLLKWADRIGKVIDG